MPDFRGTGSSSPLECDEATTYDNIITNTPQTCINDWKKKYGGDLSSFNVDEVAKDFIYLSKNVQTPVIALGRGFGSYVVHRMLQIDSSSIDAVLMDGVCVGTYCNASNWDVTRDSMLQHMVSQLGTVDTQSIAYQEYKPYQFDVLGLYRTLVARMPKKELCRVYYQYIKGYKQVPSMSTFMLSDPTLRPAFLASILFLNRCNMNEYGEAAQWFNPANNPGASRVDQYFKRTYPSGSSFLATHIIMSELTDSVTVNNSLLFTGNMQKSIAALKDWPRYANSPYRSSFAEFNKPVLLLHGEYDYQSSVSDVQIFASRYNTSTLVIMPGMMSNSIMKSYQRNSSTTCGLFLATQFINCPNCTLNMNCSSIGLSFSGDSITTKLYGNVFQPQFYPSYYGLAVPIVFGVFLIVPITFFVLLLFFHKDRRVKARLIGPYIGQIYAFIYLSNDLIGAGSYGAPDILAISISACFLLTVCATIMVLQLVRYFAMSITYHLLAKRTPSGRGLKILSSRWLFAIVVTVSAIGWFASGAIVIGVSYAEPSTLDDVYSNWLLASRMFSVILAVLAVVCGFIELILHAIRTKCNIIEYFKDPLLFRIDNFILIPIIFFAVVLASGVPTIDGVFYTIFELGLFLGVCFYFGGTVSIVCLIDFFKSFKRDTARDSIALEQGLDLSPESTTIKKLRRMLTDDKSNAIFSQYCKREWSLENLLAYNDVTALVGKLDTLSGIDVQFLVAICLCIHHCIR